MSAGAASRARRLALRPDGTKLLLLMLADQADDDDTAPLPDAALAARLGMTEAEAWAQLGALERLGLAERVHCPRRREPRVKLNLPPADSAVVYVGADDAGTVLAGADDADIHFKGE